MKKALVIGVVALWALSGMSEPGPADYVSTIPNRATFDSIARTATYPYLLPHVFFVIDRLHGDRIYYANSKKFDSHRSFANAEYLSLEKGQKFFYDNYMRQDRRFYMGTLSFQTPVQKWTFEFWEGDQIDSAGLQRVYSRIKGTFFAPIAFKPNSLRQEEAAATLPSMPRLLDGDIVKPKAYVALSIGRAVGRLRVLSHYTTDIALDPSDIVVLPQAPVDLPPVGGIITSEPASPLSHISIRSKSRGVPDAYIRNAQHDLARLQGQVVIFQTRGDHFLIGKPTKADLRLYATRSSAHHKLHTPKADLSVVGIADLAQQRARMAVVYGSKSANLGEMMNAHLANAQVPDGFTLPFSWYRDFLAETGLSKEIRLMLHDPKLNDSAYRKARLATLKQHFMAAGFSPRRRQQVLSRVHQRFSNEGLFVRSSTNSEDLPNFNGAGLYSTFPNARTDDQIINAVKFVWASVWNFEAFEARERAGIDHQKVYMAVLLQRGIKADAAGVMITGNPFDPSDRDCCFISATKGLGIKVVEGKKIPEQLLLHYETNAVQVLTRSAEDTLLTFDPNGGIKEVAVTEGRNVLSDDITHQLARAARQIKKVFGGKEQDIEWAVMGGKVYIVQSRPYLREQ